MAGLTYYVATTLDNFIADPNGKADASIFLYEGEHAADFASDIKQYDAVLMGGRTYEYGFQFGLKPGQPAYHGLKHYIFSSTMNFPSSAEVVLVREKTIEFVAKLKREEGKKLWLCGGGQLAGSLLKQGLIDQLILKVNPVIIGAGVPLFGDVKLQFKLSLVDMKRYANGVLKPIYNIIY